MYRSELDFRDTVGTIEYARNHFEELTSDTMRGAVFILDAMEEGNKELISELVDLGFSLDWRTRNNTSPLLHSCQHMSADMVEFLIEKGSNPYATDITGSNVFHYALLNEYYRFEVVNCLVEKGLNPYNKTFGGFNIFDRYNTIYRLQMMDLKTKTSFRKEDTSVKDALSAKDYELAYQIANLNIHKLGPINAYDVKTVIPFTHLLFTNIASGRLDEARTISNLILELNNVNGGTYTSASNYYSGLIDLINKDFENAAKKLEQRLKDISSEKFGSGMVLVLLYYVYSKLGKKTELSKVMKKLTSRIKYYERRGGFLTDIKPLFYPDEDSIIVENKFLEIIRELQELNDTARIKNPASASHLVASATFASLYFDLKGDNNYRDLLIEIGRNAVKSDPMGSPMLINYVLKRMYD